MLRHFLKAAINNRVGITDHPHNIYIIITQETTASLHKRKNAEAVASCFFSLQDTFVYDYAVVGN